MSKVFKYWEYKIHTDTMNNKNTANLPLSETRSRILTYLLGQKHTAMDLEDELNINESAIRRHLSMLEKDSYIKHNFETASRGRPKKVYSITEKGRTLFPQKTHLLFTLLVQAVENEDGGKKLESLLSEVASALADLLLPGNSENNIKSRMKKLVGSFDDFGFFASLETSDDYYDVKYQNCVFGNVDDEFRDYLCDMHKQIIKNAFPPCEVDIEKSIARGDNVCVHRIFPE